jgi:hypothetical protein
MDQLELPVRELRKRRNKDRERQLERDVFRTGKLLGTAPYTKAFTGELFPMMAAAVLMNPRQIGLLVVPLRTVTQPVADPRILVGGVLVTQNDRAIIAWLRTPRAGQSEARLGNSVVHAQAIPYSGPQAHW